MVKRLFFFLHILFGTACANAQWTTVCGSGDGMIVSFATYKGSIYATGFFTNMCGVNSKYIARWDGTTWYPVDTGLSDAGHRVEVLDTDLYVAQYMHSTDSNWVEKWDGSHFVRMGEGVYLTTASVGLSKIPNLYDVAKYNGHIFASGEFDMVGDKHISGIMQWDGTQWDSVGSGLSGSMDASGVMYPHQLLVHDTSLYVVGNFTTAGGVTVNGIARWDGTQWNAMGAGFNNILYGIGVFNGDIYVVGEFTFSGSTALQRIAKWNGSAWVNPGFGISSTIPGDHPYAHTVMQIGTRVVFEGGFNRAIAGTDTFIANNVIAFDGTNIDTLDGGIAGANFEGLTQWDTSILVGGAIWPATGGQDTTNVSIYHFSSLGIKVVKDHDLHLYPNPFTDAVTIENVKKGDELNLFNIVGQQVQHIVAQSPNEVLHLNALPSGSYILQISGENSVGYKQLLKE